MTDQEIFAMSPEAVVFALARGGLSPEDRRREHEAFERARRREPENIREAGRRSLLVIDDWRNLPPPPERLARWSR